MTNYLKDEESSFENDRNMSISFFEEIFEFTKIRQVYKGKVERGNFLNAVIQRSLHQFDSIFLKSWVITK